MNTGLKAALMALGAGCVLLLAGGFPLAGAPAVYRSGAMLVLGCLSGLLCLWCGWSLSAGVRLRFIAGLVCTFFASAGAGAVYFFSSTGVESARLGGVMWFGAAAMFCMAAVGLIFLGVFGFFAWRAMHRRLWLAAVHWALSLMVFGAFLDFYCEVTVPLRLVPGSGKAVGEVQVDGGILPLGFSLALDKFDVSYYPDPAYTLYRWDGAKWQPCGKPEVQGDSLVLAGHSWPLAGLGTAPGIPRPFLTDGKGRDMQLLMQDAPTVRDYCASCTVDSEYHGRKESRTVEIRVNDPLSFKGWMIHLQGWRPMGDSTLVELTARRAPGRLFSLGGMVGLLISTACWCWKRREDEPAGAVSGDEPQTAQQP